MNDNDNTEDLRMVCSVCGSPNVLRHSLNREEKDSMYTELDYYMLCPVCGEKLINGLQVAIPEIVEGRDKEDE